MADVNVVATNANSVAPSTDGSAVLPAGIQAGDAICIFGMSRTATQCLDGAFVEQYNKHTTSGLDAVSFFFLKESDGSESSTSVPFLQSGSFPFHFYSLVIRASAGDRIEFDPALDAGTFHLFLENQTAPTCPNITPGADNALIVHATFLTDGAVTGNASTSDGSTTNIGAFNNDAVGGEINSRVDYAVQGAAGAYTGPSHTYPSASGAGEAHVMTVAFTPKDGRPTLKVAQALVEALWVDAQATPIVTVTQEGEFFVSAQTSAFSPADGGGHTHTQWQITTAADTGFSSPVYDPGDDATNLTSITGAGSGVPLIGGTDYLIRARWKEDDTTYSEWSAAVAFTTTALSDLRYAPVSPGDAIVFAGKLRKADPSEFSTCSLLIYWYDEDRVQVGSPDTVLDWPEMETAERKQTTIVVPSGVRFANARVTVGLDAGELPILDYMKDWVNPQTFGLSASLSLDGSDNVDLEWETLIPAQVKFVANTTGHVSSANVEENGTFTESSESLSGSEEDVVATLGAGVTAYVTLVPYDTGGRRSGGRILLQITN